jgi:hypothetical protein
MAAAGGSAILLTSFLLGDSLPWLAWSLGSVGVLLTVVAAHHVLPEGA